MEAVARALASIDLGREVPDYSAGFGLVNPLPEAKLPTRVDYPSLHLWEAPAETWDLPEEGKAIIDYRVTGREKREVFEKGKRVIRHSVTIEVREMEAIEDEDEDVGDDEEEGGGVKSFGAVVARCRELRMRDENGVFVPAAAGATDPMAHAAAYDVKKGKKKKPEGGGGAAAWLRRRRI